MPESGSTCSNNGHTRKEELYFLRPCYDAGIFKRLGFYHVSVENRQPGKIEVLIMK